MSADAAMAKLEQLGSWHESRLEKVEREINELRLLVALENRVEDHETRLRAVERANVRLAIVVGMISTVGGLGAQILIKKWWP